MPTTLANLESCSTSTDQLPRERLSSLNLSIPDVIIVQTEPSVDIFNDTLSYPLADTTDLNIAIDDEEIVSLFQKHGNRVPFTLGMHQYFLHPVFSMLETGAA